MKRKLLLIGGGGHCHSVLDSVTKSNLYDEIGIIDYTNTSYLGVPVIGTDDDIPMLFRDNWKEAFITVGSVGNTSIRRRLYCMLKKLNMTIPIIIDSSAIIANGTKIEEGSFVGKRAIVNSGSCVGKCAIINTGAIIEHDCIIGDFAHISPGTVLCGNVHIYDDTHVGAGSVVRQQISIGNSSLIGAGSVVVKNIPANAKAYGNPCNVVKF